MPKGVEHGETDVWWEASTNVSSSVMPKGVEHLLRNRGPEAATRCVEFSDAERR